MTTTQLSQATAVSTASNRMRGHKAGDFRLGLAGTADIDDKVIGQGCDDTSKGRWHAAWTGAPSACH
jgi:hypothetical protein